MNDASLHSRARLEACLARIHDPAGQGSKVFIRLFEDAARRSAAIIDQLRLRGTDLPPLAGMLVSVKDIFDVAGSVTTAGSRVLRDAPPASVDAVIVARLHAAGAIIVGTTNMTEFSMGALGLNPHYGTPLNPFDRATGRIPGGSSSGAAISVTDAMTRTSVGSDTAGSVRIPAALTGLVGFKPTARRVPRSGAIPLSRSLDSIGPLARTISDCALLDAVLADEKPTTEAMPLTGLRLAVPQSLVLDALHPSVAQSFERSLSRLSRAGAIIVSIPFRELSEIPLLNANSRFSIVEGYSWHRDLITRCEDLYDPMIALRFKSGASVTASDYIRMLDGRADLIQRCAAVTQAFEAVLMPTVPITAPSVAAVSGDPALWLSTNQLLLRNPVVANLLDRCAITLPCHLAGEAPVGLTLMGETLGDRKILAIALAVERHFNQDEGS